MVIKLSAGTRIYLTKKKHHTLYIQPDKTLVNDNLYVAYDVRVNGETVIPKGTRVVGDWVTESIPSIAAQLQIKKIYLQGSGQDINADSEKPYPDTITMKLIMQDFYTKLINIVPHPTLPEELLNFIV